MKQNNVREGDARAKEEASKWKNEEKTKQIIKLFESGVHLSGIRDSVFPNWSADMTKDEKYYRKTTIDYIVLKVLDCEDWDEYSRKQTKLRNLRKKKKMKQSGNAQGETELTREENIETARNLLRYMEQKKLKEFSELFADNGKWVHPYHSGMFPEEYVGKKEIYNGIKNAADKFDEVKFPIDRIIPFQDPNGVAVKHTGILQLKDGTGTYENDYLAILSFDEHGKIIEWIEYYNPIKSAKAFGLMDKIK